MGHGTLHTQAPQAPIRDLLKEGHPEAIHHHESPLRGNWLSSAL